MDKIILNDNTSLEVNSIANFNNALAITFTGKTITDIEPLMTKENLTKIQEVHEDETVYGVFNNFECVSITKNLADESITINLSKLDDTQVKLDELQKTVDILVSSKDSNTTTP